MSYSVLQKILFKLDPEVAHHLTLEGLRLLHFLHLIKMPRMTSNPRDIMGLHFPHPIGLAAGLDKNGDYIEALAALGFGFVEIGTVTPKPQEGNPRPRLFRLPKAQAIINRMGFNSKGLDYVVERLKKTKYKGILGVNIGKNRETPIENALDDYRIGFTCVAPYASYVTINISSPNTASLRELQQGDLLRELLKALKQEQAQQKKYVPLVVKIAPDLNQQEIEVMSDIFLSEKVDGVIATNTTLSRAGVEDLPHANEAGGLSGKPVRALSTQTIKQFSALLKNQIPIIGCGGIFDVQDAREKFSAGASLIQVYTGLIYRGPALLSEIAGLSSGRPNEPVF